jgi:hypothetical protein
MLAVRHKESRHERDARSDALDATLRRRELGEQCRPLLASKVVLAMMGVGESVTDFLSTHDMLQLRAMDTEMRNHFRAERLLNGQRRDQEFVLPLSRVGPFLSAVPRVDNLRVRLGALAYGSPLGSEGSRQMGSAVAARRRACVTVDASVHESRLAWAARDAAALYDALADAPPLHLRLTAQRHGDEGWAMLPSEQQMRRMAPELERLTLDVQKPRDKAHNPCTRASVYNAMYSVLCGSAVRDGAYARVRSLELRGVCALRSPEIKGDFIGDSALNFLGMGVSAPTTLSAFPALRELALAHMPPQSAAEMVLSLASNSLSRLVLDATTPLRALAVVRRHERSLRDVVAVAESGTNAAHSAVELAAQLPQLRTLTLRGYGISVEALLAACRACERVSVENAWLRRRGRDGYVYNERVTALRLLDRADVTRLRTALLAAAATDSQDAIRALLEREGALG